MNGKKIMATILIGGMVASVGTGISAAAYTKKVSAKGTTKTAQTQKVNKSVGIVGHYDMKTQLDALVASGKITQDVETKVLSYLTSLEATRKTEMDKIKAMTSAERQTYFASPSNVQKKDLFMSLVSSGTLTQAQSDGLKAALEQAKTDAIQKDMKAKLDPLVTNGTITQASENSVIAYYNQLQAARQAEMEKIKAMSEADRKTYLESQKSATKPDPLADLVKNGTLTQAQADAIKKVMPGTHNGHGGRR